MRGMGNNDAILDGLLSGRLWRTSGRGEQQTVVWMAVVCFVGSALFIWRRLLRTLVAHRPGWLRDKAQVLSRHKFVDGEMLRVLYPSRRYMRIWRRMDVDWFTPPLPKFAGVRDRATKRPSAPPSEIEARWQTGSGRRTPSGPTSWIGDITNGQQSLTGITVATGDDQTYTGITSARLMDLLEGLGPDSPFLILTAPGSRDDQH